MGSRSGNVVQHRFVKVQGETQHFGYTPATWESKKCLFFQIPFYRGERITFDVAPSRLDFAVEHDSLQIEVRRHCRNLKTDLPLNIFL